MILNPVKKLISNSVEFYDFHPPAADFLTEVLAGLCRTPKSIPPKFFYDERGSELFRQICDLKEYYVTRSEMALLREKAAEIASLILPNHVVIEYGCGNSEKIHQLLDALTQCKAYAAIDISKKPLLSLTQNLAELYPQLQILAICADFMQDFQIPYLSETADHKIAFFPGSSIGNFDPEQAVEFLRQVAKNLGSGSQLLIGIDLKKEAQLLHKAYNDGQGITAAFNKNLLQRINREFNADFRLDTFEHHAFYNESQGRIEMHLTSLQKQSIHLGENTFYFEKGESIHTENSYKYSIDEFQALARQAGWEPQQYWADSNRWVSLLMFRVG